MDVVELSSKYASFYTTYERFEEIVMPVDTNARGITRAVL